MLIEQVRRKVVGERWLYWIQERESIRRKKDLGLDKPWTDDEILRNYRFCNVRRMDDKVSQWLLTHWYQPFFDHPNMLAACALARHFNLPEALEPITKHVFEQYRPAQIKQMMRARKQSGLRIFNGAYMVRGIGATDKTEMVVDKVVQPLIDNAPVFDAVDCMKMERAVNKLLPYWGFSLFMAGQVVADMRHAVSGGWRDRKLWAPVGPGSKRGMNRVLRRPVNQPLHQEEFLEQLQRLIQIASPQLGAMTNRLEAIDWQSTFCEFDKYERALSGEGRPKQLYQGA